ncbi:hypothetical protein [Pseudogracilibacillus sp. SO30301A]|uniref:hypothetical protein n=1 Tax=Pseudogracilibacillus sp. SO30301A TaxID=3098291 RepID=UPI00300E57A6
MLLIGCSQKVTEESLIEGTWIGTSGYEDEEEEGEPNCYPFEDGIEFKSEDTVYVETYDRDFDYWLSDKETTITFLDKSRYYSYDIKKNGEDKIILEGLFSQEGRGCIMVRNKD